MRRQPTPGEALLWRALRRHQLGDLKFRRQVPIGPFIADFFCPTARLVVEIDGSTHDFTQTDTQRDAWMRAQGLRVLRIPQTDMMKNLEGVVQAILAAAEEPLPLTPSRKGRGDSVGVPSRKGRGDCAAL